MWTVKLSNQAAEFLDELQDKFRRQVEHALAALAREPTCGKPLKGELKGYWSLRSGNFRIIYTIRRKEVVVEVLRIHDRKEVYEKMRRL